MEAVLAFARAGQALLIPPELSLEEHLRLVVPKLNAKARTALAARFGDWATFETAALERRRRDARRGLPGTRASVDAVGVVAARMITAFFAEDHNRALVGALMAQLTVIPAERPKTDTAVAGQTIVFTGALEKMTRDEAKAQAEGLGARFQARCPRRPTWWSRAPAAGSKLAEATRSSGVKVIDRGRMAGSGGRLAAGGSLHATVLFVITPA